MKKILIVHTGGGLGDVLLSTPLIAALKSQWPQAEIDFLARTGTVEAIRRHPQLHKVMTIDSPAPSLKQLWGWSRKLKKEGYSAALVLWSRTNLAWMLYLAGIPIRVGQDSRLSYSWTYTHKVRIRSEHGDEESHWSEILLDYGRAIGLNPDHPQPLFVISPQATQKAQSLLQDLPQAPGPIIGFHGSKGATLSLRRWPTEVFAQWVQALYNELGARLVLTGGPQEVELIADIANKSQVPLLNLAGRTSVEELAAVAKECQVFLCPDSGPMHLAAIAGTPTVGIYALAEDFPKRWAPIGAPSFVVRPNPCGCPPGCRKGTCPDFRCYRKVTEEMVVSAVKQLLNMQIASS